MLKPEKKKFLIIFTLGLCIEGIILGMALFLANKEMANNKTSSATMKTYTIDYTKISEVENCLYEAMRMLGERSHIKAEERIQEARNLVHEFLNGDNLVEDEDLADGLVRQSEAEAAIKAAVEETENAQKKAIDSMVQMAKDTNAAKASLSSERRDGYIVETIIRKKGAVAYDEFSPDQIEFIRNIFTEELLVLGDPSNANCVHKDMLDVINMCQTKLEEPEYSSIEDFFIKNPIEE